MAAYREARALYDAPTPTDPEEEERHTRAFYAATEQLRLALRREIWELDIFDSFGDPPPGDDKVREWYRVRELRHEREQWGHSRTA